METIIQIQVKAISYRATSFLLLETIFCAFFHIYSIRWKQFFGVVETYFFLTNPSFRLVESEFLFSEKSIPLVGMKDFLETLFPLDGKKLSLAGVSEK